MDAGNLKMLLTCCRVLENIEERSGTDGKEKIDRREKRLSEIFTLQNIISTRIISRRLFSVKAWYYTIQSGPISRNHKLISTWLYH